MKIAYHPSGQYIEFYEEEHKYISNGKEYLSATSLVGNYFTEFDAHFYAEKKAAKQNVSKEEILEMWSKNADSASEHGRKIHLYLENSFLGKPIDFIDIDESQKKLLSGIVEDIKFKYDVIEPEKIVFSPELGLSGTIDLFAHISGTKTYLIADWKTNAKFEVENKFNKFGLGLLSHVPDTKLHTYSLQVNVYKEILIREGYIPHDAEIKLLISHINHDAVKKNYLAIDYSKEIKDIFNEYSQKNRTP